MNTNIRFDSLGSAINLEKWWVAEGLDDDKGMIPKEGYSISGKAKHFLKTDSDIFLYPYVGIGFEKWEKRKAESRLFSRVQLLKKLV